MLWSGETVQKITQQLDVAALRQQVIAHNIANLNTPGFKRSYVPFSDELQKARGKFSLRRTHARHMEGRGLQEPGVKTEAWTSRRPDGNNVDLDKEMIALVTNQLRFNLLVQQLNGLFAGWRNVINEGRG